MTTMMVGIEYYGGRHVRLDRVDIRAMPSLSVDLRAQTGHPQMPPDETRVMPAGVFTLSVCGQLPGEYPVGEIRIWYSPANREVRIVGHLTGRQDVMELTPDHLMASQQDPAYRAHILKWLGIAA